MCANNRPSLSHTSPDNDPPRNIRVGSDSDTPSTFSSTRPASSRGTFAFN